MWFFVLVVVIELGVLCYGAWVDVHHRREMRALDREWDRFTGQQR